MSIILEHDESSGDGTLNYTVVVNLAQVNKRFNPVKVLPKASHCQSEFNISMV